MAGLGITSWRVTSRRRHTNRRAAISRYASWIGAMIMARAVDDRALSQEILEAVLAEPLTLVGRIDVLDHVEQTRLDQAGNVGALPAVANALVDALSPLGIRHIEMPATPERLWRTIRQA